MVFVAVAHVAEPLFPLVGAKGHVHQLADEVVDLFVLGDRMACIVAQIRVAEHDGVE